MNECGFQWDVIHECTKAAGHDGRHHCAEHYERCCEDCIEAWADRCGATPVREAVDA